MTSTTESKARSSASVAYRRVGTKRAPIVVVPQCRTCCSKRRRKIETLLLEGVSPGRILERVPADHATTAQSIKRHLRRGHVPFDSIGVAAKMRELSEREWQDVGELATEQRAREAASAQTLLNRFADIPESTITATVLLKAARFIYDVEQEERRAERELQVGTWRLDQMARDMASVIDLVGDVAGDAVRNEVFRRAARASSSTSLALIGREFDHLRQLVDNEDWERRVAARQRTGP